MASKKWDYETTPKFSDSKVSFSYDSKIVRDYYGYWLRCTKNLLIGKQIVFSESWDTSMDEDDNPTEREPDSEEMWKQWVKGLGLNPYYFYPP